MSTRYSTLLSPLRIGNQVLKNRMLFPNASPHFLQGPETFPAEGLMTFYTNLTKSGAAVITLAEWDNPEQRKIGWADSLRMQSFDLTDPSVHNYFSQLADDVHFYGSKMCVEMRLEMPAGYSLNGGLTRIGPPGTPPVDTQMLPSEKIPEVIDGFVNKAELYKSFGYDMVAVRFENFLQPGFSTRKDQYSAEPFENRARFMLEFYGRIKERLGQDFLTMAVIKGETFTGYTLENVVEFAKLAEGKIDIFHLRAKDPTKGDSSGYATTEFERVTPEYTEAVKKSGAKVVTLAVGGFQDPVEMERYLAEGKTDMIGIARGLFADPDFIKKLYDDRGEDIVPCIRCNKCHGTMSAPWISICSVNPIHGNAHKIHRMVEAPAGSRKVAVIGGGPAGMAAALFAKDRGHNVTLYEKSNMLGGQLVHSDYSSFKWPVRKFKDYLIRQLYKKNINVMLNTLPSPDMIKAEGYDAVIAATGAKPNIPDIPGVKKPDGSLADGLMTIMDVYGRESELGKSVIIVGGSESGVETGMYLAENDHDVTVLTRQEMIAHDASKIHSLLEVVITGYSEEREEMGPAWLKYKNLKGITNAVTKSVTPDSVTYTDSEGKDIILKADSIVICGGMIPRIDEALAYAGSADRFFIAGDVEGPDDIQKCMRSAFARASQI